MNSENQNIEYKESWRDEYLKWICGFANAQGGTLYVGVNDKGDVCGVADAKKLMEDVPNKVRDLMGILVDVNLKEQGNKEYLEITIEPHPFPVSFRGKYYQRSGATNQEVKGAALDRFMLRLLGKTWDGVPVPYLTVEDLDSTTFDLFRKRAKRSGRMDENDLADDNKGLLEKLRLFEGTYLKRAAALLFHSDPERYVSGAYVKVGFFREDMDLIYQDEIHGNLFQQITKLMDLICTKYLKAVITYEDIHRVETLPIPREALREALLNACINKDYANRAPIQIRVTDSSLEIINVGTLPDNWTVETLLSSHSSQPYNPEIANTFFRAGDIEAWGRGIERIIKACRDEGFSTTEFKCNESGVWTIFRFKYPERVKGQVEEAGGQKPNQSAPESAPESALKIMRFLHQNPKATMNAISEELGMSRRWVANNLKKLQEMGKIKRMGPHKGGYWEVME